MPVASDTIAVNTGPLIALTACGGSVAGSASGTCRVRFGSRDPAPDLPPGERTDSVTVALRESGRDVDVRFGDCTLVASPAPAGPSNHYLITSGHCHADVPTQGVRDFDVADRRPDGSETEDSGEEAYLNVTTGPEVFLEFEARVSPGWVRYSCELARVP